VVETIVVHTAVLIDIVAACIAARLALRAKLFKDALTLFTDELAIVHFHTRAPLQPDEPEQSLRQRFTASAPKPDSTNDAALVSDDEGVTVKPTKGDVEGGDARGTIESPSRGYLMTMPFILSSLLALTFSFSALFRSTTLTPFWWAFYIFIASLCLTPLVCTFHTAFLSFRTLTPLLAALYIFTMVAVLVEAALHLPLMISKEEGTVYTIRDITALIPDIPFHSSVVKTRMKIESFRKCFDEKPDVDGTSFQSFIDSWVLLYLGLRLLQLFTGVSVIFELATRELEAWKLICNSSRIVIGFRGILDLLTGWIICVSAGQIFDRLAIVYMHSCGVEWQYLSPALALCVAFVGLTN